MPKNVQAFFRALVVRFVVAVSDLRLANNNTPRNNPDFPVCHQLKGYPIEPITVYCESGPRLGRYVSVSVNSSSHFALCEVKVDAAQCKSHRILCKALCILVLFSMQHATSK